MEGGVLHGERERGVGGVVQVSGAEFGEGVQGVVQDFQFGKSVESVGVLSKEEGNEKESYEEHYVSK